MQQSEGPQRYRRGGMLLRLEAGQSKKNALKNIALSFQIRILACPFAREAKECAQLGVSSAAACAQSSATAPTISKDGNIISQDLERLYKKKKKVTMYFDNFLGNFRETNPRLH